MNSNEINDLTFKSDRLLENGYFYGRGLKPPFKDGVASVLGPATDNNGACRREHTIGTIQCLAYKIPDLRAPGRRMYANRNIHLHCNSEHLSCRHTPGFVQSNSLC